MDSIEVFGYVYIVEVETIELPDGEVWTIEHEIGHDCRDGYSSDTDEDGDGYYLSEDDEYAQLSDEVKAKMDKYGLEWYEC